MKDKSIPKLEQELQNDAKLILNHAIKHNVPSSWYFQHLQGHVFRATEQLHSDADFLLQRGEEAAKWYDANIKEYERRKGIFGKKKE